MDQEGMRAGFEAARISSTHHECDEEGEYRELTEDTVRQKGEMFTRESHSAHP